jgi:putative transposase
MIPLEMKQMAVNLIDEAVNAGASCYMASELLGISQRTYRRWSVGESPVADRRGEGAKKRKPSHALTEQEKQEILQVCNSAEHKSLPPTQIVPKLADQGVYIASEASFYRVLKANNQINRRGAAQLPKKVVAPQTLTALDANQVWSWDITYLPSVVRGQFLRLYMVIDVFSRMIVAWEVHWEEASAHAASLIEKACLVHGVRRNQLTLHSDNGSPMKGATMLATLQRLGIMPSFSRPSVSDDNPYSEAMFRTLKYTPAYPAKPFEDIDHARAWVHTFVNWYNTEHRHSGIKFVTPAQRHSGRDEQLLAQRTAVYESAKERKPLRWNRRKTRNWHRIEEVWLNPPRQHCQVVEKIPLAA